MSSNGDKMGFQSGGEGISNCESSGMSIINPYFSSPWDPVVTLNQNGSFGGPSMVSQSEFIHYPPDSTYGELLPKYPSYGSGSFSEMVGSFGITNDAVEDPQLSPIEASPNGRRRKRLPESSSPHDPNKNAEGELQKDLAGHNNSSDEKKSKNAKGKQAAKENSNSGEAPPKEDYIHVRARRGQATNSHSLAERVRREKISERMRLLQELVPGCNKITGKAVMLDEIINYVQSLQQQVEFLSMKLATVNPEMNIDIDRILSKDILHSRGGNATILGLNTQMNVHPYSHGFFPASIPGLPNSNPQFAPVHHNVLENDLQNLLQMGFDSGSAMDSLGPNGRLKPEL